MRDRPMRECTLRWRHLALKRWQWGPAPGDAPGDSWLRAIRVALGMTSRQLAARLGVSEPAVRGAERAEMDGSVSLATLRRYAAGLECELAYVLLPPATSLRSMLQDRAAALCRARSGHLEIDAGEIR